MSARFPVLAVGALLLACAGGSAQDSATPDSGHKRLAHVIDALGGKERLLAIRGFQAGLLFSNYAVQRYIRPEQVAMSAKKHEERRQAAETQALLKGPEAIARLKQLPAPDPSVRFAILDQHHQRLQIELPSRARNVVLNLNTRISEEGDEIGLDIIDQDADNGTVVQKRNQAVARKRLEGQQTDLSYALFSLGLVRHILTSEKVEVSFEGTEAQYESTLDIIRLQIPDGPYRGTWRVKVDPITCLPAAVEYLDGLPQFLVTSETMVFSSEAWSLAPYLGRVLATRSTGKKVAAVAALGALGGYGGIGLLGRKTYGPVKADVQAALKEYRERIRFVQTYSGYRDQGGVMFPGLVRTTVVVPEKNYDNEWSWVQAFLSLEWTPASVPVSLGGDLKKFVVESLPRSSAPIASEITPGSDTDLLKLLELQRCYRQLVWSAVFTANQFQGEYVRSPRYIVLSPDWARFYNLDIKFPEERPISRQDFRKMILAHKENAVGILKSRNRYADIGGLERAFAALAQVAQQGLTVYNRKGSLVPLQRWARCFDADNIAVGAAQIALDLDQQLLAQGWRFRTAREFFASTGIDPDKLLAVGIDLERNRKGASREQRAGLVVALIGGSAAGGIIAAAAAPAAAGASAGAGWVQPLITSAGGLIYSAAASGFFGEPPLFSEQEPTPDRSPLGPTK